MRPIRSFQVCRSLAPVLLLGLTSAGLGLGGCNKSGQRASSNYDTDSPTVSKPASSLSCQELYEAKRYPEAKAQALRDAQQTTGHDQEVALLTAGLSAHAMQQYDDAATILTPLTRSEDSRIAGRAKSALDYIGIERGRKTAALASPTGGQPGTSVPQQPSAASTTARGFTLQAGVFTSMPNARRRAGQLRASAVKAGLGEPKIVPDTVNGKQAYAVQIGSFGTKQAANDAMSKLTGPLVVMAVQ